LLFNQDREVKQRDIEQEFQIKHPTVTGMLDLLENKDFIQRTVPQEDRRCRQITLTGKFLKVSKEILEKGKSLEKKITRGFSEEEQTQLQLFIGQSVGYLGNAVTNVIFPLTVLAMAISLMLGDGGAVFMNLNLGQGNKKDASKAAGNVVIASLLFQGRFCSLFPRC
jgi:DNA-binding MarR family transcriptional regulator